MVRRSGRLAKPKSVEVRPATNDDNNVVDEDAVKDDVDNDDEEEDERPTFTMNGVVYQTYQELVAAKRERNEKMLLEFGLLSAASAVKESVKQQRLQTTVGIKKRKVTKSDEILSGGGTLRKSIRLAGGKSDGLFVDNEKSGVFAIGGLSEGQSIHNVDIKTSPKFYRGRINDGSALTVEKAVENIGSKWLQDNSVQRAEILFQQVLLPDRLSVSTSSPSFVKNRNMKKGMALRMDKRPSPTGVTDDDLFSTNNSWVKSQIDSLTCDDSTKCVAKVCPDRIYGIALHPSSDHLLVCAGDKNGYVGLWNVDQSSSFNSNLVEIEQDPTIKADTNNNDDGLHPTNKANKSKDDDGVHLFRFHTGAAVSLHWTASGSKLISTSYDGTVRSFDARTESIEQIFATYDDTAVHKHELGYGLDTGSHFWTQFGCLDHRNDEECMFLSTSVGTAMHLDFRQKGRITFHEELSEKKINSLSLHPNGYSLMSSGLDNTVRVWDIRNLGDSRSSTGRSKKSPQPLAVFNGGKSVNSSYFSPSGRYAVSTTMANKLDFFENLHLGDSHSKKNNVNGNLVQPFKRMYHDNMTGRWLSTFMATYHPSLDIFCVGSMQKPRAVEIFDASGQCLRSITGDALTAVASRCCFHPRTDRIIVAGGNSSGRVTIIR